MVISITSFISFLLPCVDNFLNFSKTHPIEGINIIENLLFWTDNRNQPRKVNINQNEGYYTLEQQISVAKYNPYQAIELWQASTLGGAGKYETTMKDVTAVPPKLNAVASVKSLPVMVTVAPLAAETGVKELIIGALTKVNPARVSAPPTV